MNPENVTEILFSSNGRITRKTYWLFCFIPSVIIGTILIAAHVSKPVFIAVALLTLWPSLAMHIKRWHDQDRSGWWQLLGAIPFIGGFVVMFFCGFIKGTSGSNRFGTDPLEN
jgi:uncharacterized membrane protein YhaH (DUF805 family)